MMSYASSIPNKFASRGADRYMPDAPEVGPSFSIFAGDSWGFGRIMLGPASFAVQPCKSIVKYICGGENQTVIRIDTLKETAFNEEIFVCYSENNFGERSKFLAWPAETDDCKLHSEYWTVFLEPVLTPNGIDLRETPMPRLRTPEAVKVATRPPPPISATQNSPCSQKE